MRRFVVLLIAGLITLSAGEALAQYGYNTNERNLELIPFVGYRWGGSMSTIPGLSKFDTDDTYSYGGAVDFRTPTNAAVELYWSHFEGDVHATLAGGGGTFSGGPLKRDDLMLNGVWYAYRNRPITPYFTLGLGASIFSSQKTETYGRFAWNVGLGLRRDIGKRLGVRVDGRWIPTWVTTGSGAWCDPFYGCYTVGTGEFYDQVEASAGLIVRL